MSRSHAALVVLRALRSAKSGPVSSVASSPLMKGTPVAAHVTEVAPVFGSMVTRTFATSYLDKAEVTDRVLSVVKAFDKVEASKVRFPAASRVSRCATRRPLSLTYIPRRALVRLRILQITPSAVFQKDLGLDSLDTVELVMAIEEEFAIEIPDSEADKIMSCEDAITYIASNPMAK
jgi:NADH dehydrogenase (ubiquinone) 1 alpha/beta subcomplex 1